MSQGGFRIASRIVWPGGLSLAAAALLLHRWTPPEDIGPWWDLLPQLLLGAAALLAARFKRGRIVFAVGTIWLAAHWANGSSTALKNLLCIAVAINLMTLGVLKERGTLGLKTWFRWLLVGLIGAIGYAPEKIIAPVETFVSAPIMDWSPAAYTPLSIGAITAILAAAAVLVWRLVRTGGALESGLLGTLVGWALMTHFPPGSLTSHVFFASIGLTLLLAIIEGSYSLAYEDQLTELPGRRALEEQLMGLGGNYTLAMVDIDRFKKFNDRYGHDAGDEVLRMVASHLRSVKGGGRAFRYGGEEFTVVFPGRSIKDVAPHLENLRNGIASARFTLRAPNRPTKKPKKPAKSTGRGQVKISVSIGAAQRGKNQDQPDAVLKLADKRLYKAKRGGRNRVVAA